MLAEELQGDELKNNLNNGDEITSEMFERVAENYEGKIEYIDWKVYMFAGGIYDHSDTANDISQLIGMKLKKPCKSRVELPWYYDKDNDKIFIQPDIAVVCDGENYKGKKYQGQIKFVIEILSPSTAKYDRNKKKQKYRELGVEEYIIVDLISECIEVFELQQSDTGITYYYEMNKEFEFISKVNEDIRFRLCEVFEWV